MKKIINKSDDVVPDMLRGMAKAYPYLCYTDEDTNVLYRRERKQGKVAIVSGGGAGHEPAHAGYVGYGMLDAAVTGNVFASPGPEAILEGIRRANTGCGALLIIKNYSGDIMNFELAGELAGAEGIETDYVVVKDDVAVPDSTYSTGRRGICGTVLVHKSAGAAAERGYPLAEVKRVAQKAIDNVRSMGMAMSSCILPSIGQAGFHMAEGEIEIGMGIHGEPGINRQPIQDAKTIAAILLEKILSDYDFKGAEVACVVNGLGGTPLMELHILFGEVANILKDRSIYIARSYVGNYMTSLEMAGASVTLLKLDEELKRLLDDPAKTPAFSV